MHRLLLVIIVSFLVNSFCFSQKDKKSGQIEFKIKNGEEVDYSSSIEIHYSELGEMYSMSTSNGVIKINYFWPSNDTVEIKLLVHLGRKLYYVTDLPNEELQNDQTLIHINSIETIKYKKRKKMILGHKCYAAEVTLKNGEEWVYYLTDEIPSLPCAKKPELELKGFPLEFYHKKSNTSIQASYEYGSTSMYIITDMQYYEKITYEEFKNLE